MHHLTRTSLFLIVVAMMSACSVAPRVESRVETSYDDSMSLSEFSTFNFSSRTEIENPDQAGELELYFAAAVEEQMLLNGLVKSDMPDLLINVAVNIENKSIPQVKYHQCPTYQDYLALSSSDAYRHQGRTQPMCEYKEGSVNVEMVGTKFNRKAFEGVSLVRLDDEDTGNRLLLSVLGDVETMFDVPSNQRRWLSNTNLSPPPNIGPEWETGWLPFLKR